MEPPAGRVQVADMTREVTFSAVEGASNARIDEAYRMKYRGSRYLSPMIGVRAREATIKVMPRATKETESQNATKGEAWPLAIQCAKLQWRNLSNRRTILDE